MPSTIRSERVAVPVSRPRMLTLTARSITAPAFVATPAGITLAAGKVLNRSAVFRAPVMAKSCGLRLVTGTPTAAVPRISEPVISTVSGTSSAWATISPCACAGIVLASVSSDAELQRAASRDRVLQRSVRKFIGFPQFTPSPGEALHLGREFLVACSCDGPLPTDQRAGRDKAHPGQDGSVGCCPGGSPKSDSFPLTIAPRPG